jgi:hypothetical protein
VSGQLGRWALRDGRISLSEAWVLAVLRLSTSGLLIADLIVVIWVLALPPSPVQGSVVVFGNYSSWSYTDPASAHYCAHTPMLFAFVLLLVRPTTPPVQCAVCSVQCPVFSAQCAVPSVPAGEVAAAAGRLPGGLPGCRLLPAAPARGPVLAGGRFFQYKN